jgi:hypothetical protein
MHDPGMALAARDIEATLRLFRALGDETRLRLQLNPFFALTYQILLMD